MQQGVDTQRVDHQAPKPLWASQSIEASDIQPNDARSNHPIRRHDMASRSDSSFGRKHMGMLTPCDCYG